MINCHCILTGILVRECAESVAQESSEKTKRKPAATGGVLWKSCS